MKPGDGHQNDSKAMIPTRHHLLQDRHRADLRRRAWDHDREDAAKVAVETAAKTLRDLRIAEVEQMGMQIDEGKVISYRTRVKVSFKYEG